ncbi:MAG TPA: four-carbon acid sugar kinase family protein, partial [Chloroflexota bacterium]|nr:four-carbon acid sugar kinase family protein [Chloroflexota bacterium]
MRARYALIADDLTGALDAGAGFVSSGLRAALPFSGEPGDVPDADVVLINTESRERSAAEAAERARGAAERLKAAGIDRAYKKMDSVLRGHPGPELGAVLDVFRGRALVAPAFPAQGRVTRGGVQYAHGAPVEPFGGFLRDALEGAAARADVRDAETDAELARIAHDAAGNAAYRVWCGTAGLAKHVPTALNLTPSGELPPLPTARRVYVIAGTGHAATNAQLDALRDAHLPDVEILVEGRAYWSRGAQPEAVYAAIESAASRLPLGERIGL